MRELVTFRSSERKAQIKAEAKKTGVMRLRINDGDCNKCPVAKVCDYWEEDTPDCKLIAVACEQITQQASMSRFAQETDSLAFRNLASLYAGIVYSELYFSRFGTTRVKQKTMEVVYTEMYKDYLRIVQKFDEMAGNFGLSPYGRRKLLAERTKEEDKGSPLLSYVIANYGSGDPAGNREEEETAEEEGSGDPGSDQHHRLLPRPESPKPALAGYPSSFTKGSIRPKNAAKRKGASKKHSRRSRT